MPKTGQKRNHADACGRHTRVWKGSFHRQLGQLCEISSPLCSGQSTQNRARRATCIHSLSIRYIGRQVFTRKSCVQQSLWYSLLQTPCFTPLYRVMACTVNQFRLCPAMMPPKRVHSTDCLFGTRCGGWRLKAFRIGEHQVVPRQSTQARSIAQHLLFRKKECLASRQTKSSHAKTVLCSSSHPARSS